jgi:NADH-quinone oxidoreductase subunit F
MGETIADSSLCGLGTSGPNPVLTTIRYFSHEYRAHIEEKRCPALACRAMLRFQIDPQKCRACGLCVWACPAKAISASPGCSPIIEQAKCNQCGSCLDSCPEEFQAVIKTSGESSLSLASHQCFPRQVTKSGLEVPR